MGQQEEERELDSPIVLGMSRARVELNYENSSDSEKNETGPFERGKSEKKIRKILLFALFLSTERPSPIKKGNLIQIFPHLIITFSTFLQNKRR